MADPLRRSARLGSRTDFFFGLDGSGGGRGMALGMSEKSGCFGVFLRGGRRGAACDRNNPSLEQSGFRGMMLS